MNKLVDPCRKCPNNCDDDKEFCYSYQLYLNDIEMRSQTAWAIVDWLKEGAFNPITKGRCLERDRAALTITRMALEQYLKSEGIEEKPRAALGQPG